MNLNNTKIKNAKAESKAYKLTDGGGLYLLVTAKGQKYWRLDYRFAGKRKTLSIGVYPAISLKQARLARDEAKQQIAQDIDPAALKREKKQKLIEASNNTFKEIAIRWHDFKKDEWTDHHSERIIKQLRQRAFPVFGSMPIDEITAPMVLKVLRSMQREGLGEATSRLKSNLQRIFTFAIAEDRASHNPVTGLEQALKKQPPVKHMSYLKESELSEFFSSLEAYQCHPQIKLAFHLIAHTMLRTQELRFLKWEYLDLEAKEIHLPASIMKRRRPHTVPMSRQVIEIIKELEVYNGEEDFIFAGLYGKGKPMSENTMIQVIYRMGFKGRATVHGFRSTASTILNENKFRADAIEKQLAHQDPNEVRDSYNRSDYLQERKDMMQWYSDKLDSLLAGKDNVIIANFRRK